MEAGYEGVWEIGDTSERMVTLVVRLVFHHLSYEEFDKPWSCNKNILMKLYNVQEPFRSYFLLTSMLIVI